MLLLAHRSIRGTLHPSPHCVGLVLVNRCFDRMTPLASEKSRPPRALARLDAFKRARGSLAIADSLVLTIEALTDSTVRTALFNFGAAMCGFYR